MTDVKSIVRQYGDHEVPVGGSYAIDPAHTSVEFVARHLMITKVRGRFSDVSGTITISDEPELSHVEVEVGMASVDTGNGDRDAHLRSADFFDVETHPRITFRGGFTERTGDTAFKGEVDLTIRGVTRTVPLDVHYLGEWKTPWWDGDENKGEMRRIGWQATARIDRHDFGVSWQDELPRGGVVVSNEIELVLDVEAILLEDLERTGAIDYYRALAR